MPKSYPRLSLEVLDYLERETWYGHLCRIGEVSFSAHPDGLIFWILDELAAGPLHFL